MTKRKSDCTTEEWEKIKTQGRERNRRPDVQQQRRIQRQEKYKADPETYKERRRAYLSEHREDTNARQRAKRLADPERARLASKQRAIKRQQISAGIVLEWLERQGKSFACEQCGENDPAVLVFHHIDPSTKETAVSCLLRGPKEMLLKELEKCVVLCANCHSRIHRPDAWQIWFGDRAEIREAALRTALDMAQVG